jgi:hypothetical protein
LIIEALATESDLIGVSIGDQALVNFESFPDIEYRARLQNISPVEIDVATTNFVLRLVTRDTIDPNYWGMRVEVFFDE